MAKVHGMFFSSLLDSTAILSDPLCLIRSVDVFSLDIEDVSCHFCCVSNKVSKKL